MQDAMATVSRGQFSARQAADLICQLNGRRYVPPHVFTSLRNCELGPAAALFTKEVCDVFACHQECKIPKRAAKPFPRGHTSEMLAWRDHTDHQGEECSFFLLKHADAVIRKFCRDSVDCDVSVALPCKVRADLDARTAFEELDALRKEGFFILHVDDAADETEAVLSVWHDNLPKLPSEYNIKAMDLVTHRRAALQPPLRHRLHARIQRGHRLEAAAHRRNVVLPQLGAAELQDHFGLIGVILEAHPPGHAVRGRLIAHPLVVRRIREFGDVLAHALEQQRLLVRGLPILMARKPIHEIGAEDAQALLDVGRLALQQQLVQRLVEARLPVVDGPTRGAAVVRPASIPLRPVHVALQRLLLRLRGEKVVLQLHVGHVVREEEHVQVRPPGAVVALRAFLSAAVLEPQARERDHSGGLASGSLAEKMCLRHCHSAAPGLLVVARQEASHDLEQHVRHMERLAHRQIHA